MKKIILFSLAAILLSIILLIGYTVYIEQRADYSWRPNLPQPTFATDHPVVVVDQAHNNASTAGIAGRYWPFGRLLRADGYKVEKGKEKFSPVYLAKTNVLVIVNASGAPKPQILGINLPMGTKGDRGTLAFTSEEIKAVVDWIEQGGSLLLVADHAPFGSASEAMGAAFGVTMFKGFVEVPNELSDPLMFSDSNGRLGNHPIIQGDGANTIVRRVMTFTGQSLKGPDSATILLKLPENAVEYLPVPNAPEGTEMQEHPAGDAQALAFTFGKGRVVICGEAAMLTAQVSNGQPFGMNLEGNDNKQFALNIMHWLSGKL